MEIKAGDGELTAAEDEFFDTWRGQRCIVRSAEEALMAIGRLSEWTQVR